MRLLLLLVLLTCSGFSQDRSYVFPKNPYVLNGRWWNQTASTVSDVQQSITIKKSIVQATFESVALTDREVYYKYFAAKQWTSSKGIQRCVEEVNLFYEYDHRLDVPVYHAIIASNLKINGASQKDIETFLRKIGRQLEKP